jgi:hypothetical protein
MYTASAALLGALGTRFPALSSLNRRNVVMHREIRASKTCPGFKVDLSRLILEAGGPPIGPRTREPATVTRTTREVQIG